VEIVRLPADCRFILYDGIRFCFCGGVWYRPSGKRYRVVAPPIGLFVDLLPPHYTTIWVRGVPYYYANDVYYAQQASGYLVVAPPQESVSQTRPAADKPFVYPRLGQSETQQATDRYECHRWAVTQTGFDPTQPHAAAAAVEKREAYQKDFAACLDGRGYTVK
jgi:hypothetical protein